MRPVNTYQVLIDFDGTISRLACADAILQQFAASAWLRVEREWVDGKIGSGQCMREQAALLRATPAAVRRFIDAIPLDEGLREVIEVCGRIESLVLDDSYHLVTSDRQRDLTSAAAIRFLAGLDCVPELPCESVAHLVAVRG